MRLTHLILLPAALFLTAPASAGDAPGGKVYKTPQAVFDALVQANKAGNWKQFCNRLTPESRDMVAGVLVLAGSDIKSSLDAAVAKEKDEDKRAFLKGMMKEVFKPVTEAYEKHGVTEKHLQKTGGMMMLAFTGGDRDKVKKLLSNAAKPVKDRTAFIDDLLSAMKKLEKMFGKAKKGSAFDFFPADAKLEDLKVEGDTAMGTLVGTKKGVEKREPIHFKKYQGGWRVELPMDEPKGKEERGGKSGDKTGALGVPPFWGEVVRAAPTARRAEGPFRRGVPA
jgi:hypothetical protein